MQLPGDVNAAIRKWLAESGPGSARAASGNLTTAYRAGQSSAAVDVATYLVVRAPATFAAVDRALHHLAEANPGFSPNSLFDVGAGPGTASWAAMARWPGIATITMLDRDQRFIDAATALAAELKSTIDARIGDLSAAFNTTADLVIAAYVLAELPAHAAAAAARNLWQATTDTLLIVEPGTPEGFRRIRAARDALIGSSAYIIAPCTHHAACPMEGDDWCHFRIRLARTREHMHAKNATVPFEEEPFSYLAVSRQPVVHHGTRILAPPQETKFSRSFKLCGSQGLVTETIATRNKAAYKQARKLEWGDAFKRSE